MAAKATKLARIGDRTQARMVEFHNQLREQEERYRGIFENSTEGIFLADADAVSWPSMWITSCPSTTDTAMMRGMRS